MCGWVIIGTTIHYIIVAVISVARYLTDMGEHIALYKFMSKMQYIYIYILWGRGLEGGSGVGVGGRDKNRI